ncbi:diacylglycerol/polyprenol kinase family protein [Pyrococcus abyssi]|uniref:Integral membrane protein, putative n=1 Tax=Pyrococcus abyssi (strain GE5 / Orsay) TaxID=272844 RepID=Q9UZD4_PYRAB|nr:diacylglycerol/polyprenol kinase family protein [Pyrococcus abyssi]CAB50125.1 Integral membrane protein, putative [Pyrococcus abyssi GE5]CCE70650.1 TPA: phosphatidate cytidylyltransferase [Pyrococcus abyssi GE5]
MSLKLELKRKALHMTGLSVPIIYLLFGREATLIFVSTFLVIFLALEPFRLVEELRDKVKRKLGIPDGVMAKIEREIDGIAREHEKRGLGAHIYFTLAALIIVYFFPKEVTIGSISLATIGDAMAAIVGKTYGRHRFENGKSVEGSLAYLITGLLILTPLVGLKMAFIGSLVGMIAEFYDIPPDDNFSNQLAIALALYLAGVRA